MLVVFGRFTPFALLIKSIFFQLYMMTSPVRVGLRSLRGFLSPCRSRPISLKNTPCRFRSNSSVHSSILGQTSLMIQDGVEMHELPLVIRRMEASDISNWEHPFVNVSYKGEEKAKTTTQEELFKQVLSGCLDLSGVSQAF